MLFAGTIRLEGDRGISYVVREKFDFVQVQVETDGGELLLEFAPKIAESLRLALNEIQSGSERVAVDRRCEKCRIKPDIFAHFDDEKVMTGFSGGDDSNPINEEWPALVIKGSSFDLSLCMNPEQAAAVADLCQRVVGLGAAAKAFDERIIETEEQTEEAAA
jgi:hypothetical protein